SLLRNSPPKSASATQLEISRVHVRVSRHAVGADSYAQESIHASRRGDWSMGVLWPLEPHTEAKHRLYKRYLDAWFPIFLQQSWVKRVTYVDAFAGPGEYKAGEEGSPTFALDRLLHHDAQSRMNLTRKRVTLIF